MKSADRMASTEHKAQALAMRAAFSTDDAFAKYMRQFETNPDR